MPPRCPHPHQRRFAATTVVGFRVLDPEVSVESRGGFAPQEVIHTANKPIIHRLFVEYGSNKVYIHDSTVDTDASLEKHKRVI